MTHLNWIRRMLWLVPIMLGVVFVVAGAYMVYEGRDAKNQVHDTLVAEQITTSPDASIPNAPVNDAATAQAQADAIREHSLKASNGKTYAQMDRSDPNRATYLNGVTLRTSLSLAVMGFRVSDLVIGLGAFIIVLGASNILVVAPLAYWIGEGAAAREQQAAKQALTARPAPSA